MAGYTNWTRKETLEHHLSVYENLAMENGDKPLLDLIKDLQKRLAQIGREEEIINDVRAQYEDILYGGKLKSKSGEEFKNVMNKFFDTDDRQPPYSVGGRPGNQSSKVDVRVQSLSSSMSSAVDAGPARSRSPRAQQLEEPRKERKQRLEHLLKSNENLAMEHQDKSLVGLIKGMQDQLAKGGKNEDVIENIGKQYKDMLYDGKVGSGEAANEFKKDMNKLFDIPKHFPLNTAAGGRPGLQTTKIDVKAKSMNSTMSSAMDTGPGFEQLKQKAQKQEEMLQKELQQNSQYQDEIVELKLKLHPLDALKKEFGKQMAENRQLRTTLEQMFQEKGELEKHYEDAKKYIHRKKAEHEEEIKNEKRKFNAELKKIMTERDDLRDRFSKLAGAKLTDQNPDIADLSDPNRAMKLSEKFGALYDDEWTNAFEALTEKIKLEPKHAIQTLLQMLSEAWNFCERMSESQIQSLNSVLLHPIQDVAKIDSRQTVSSSKDRPRINSKNVKDLQNVRRDIGVMPSTVNEIKQAFHLDMKSRNKDKKPELKIVEACSPYLESCAEICWLMILPDPPLFIHLDVKPGDKMDPTLYAVYSTSGDKVNFLVWPALFNCKGGGLLSKGVVEPVRTVKKS